MTKVILRRDDSQFKLVADEFAIRETNQHVHESFEV